MAESPAKQNRREEILKAAGKCLIRYGFDKMTMDDVGTEVGLNKASLYYYYRSKEALAADVLTSEAGRFIAELRRKVDSEKGCSKRMETYLVERFRISQRVVNLHNMSLRNFRQIRPLFRKLHQQFKDEEAEFIARILGYCIDSGELRDFDVDRVARSILSIVEAYKSQVLDDPDLSPDATIDYSHIEDDLIYTVSLILGGLGDDRKTST